MRKVVRRRGMGVADGQSQASSERCANKQERHRRPRTGIHVCIRFHILFVQTFRGTAAESKVCTKCFILIFGSDCFCTNSLGHGMSVRIKGVKMTGKGHFDPSE